MGLSASWCLFIIPSLILLHLFVSPYTKVEESFNVQATHDTLKYGMPIKNATLKLKVLFDHMTFSGAVPRTFVGALVLAGLSKPVIWMGNLHGLSEQIAARASLGLLNALAFVVYTRAIKRAYGTRVALWYTFLQASQFHLIYYASRPLPNMYAVYLSTLALSYLLPDPNNTTRYHDQIRLAFYLLAVAAVIFRSEIALLISTCAGLEILKSGSFRHAIDLVRRAIVPAVVVSAAVGITLTVSVDTYFWQSERLLWPELSAFWFNVLPKDHQGASAWGTSPWHWYFTSAIPRLTMGPSILLLPYGLLFTTQRSAIASALIPSMGYTILYSILPHKETRFLFPIVPQLTLATAIPASYLSLRHTSIARVVTFGLILSTALTTFISHAIILPLSAQSYPGGSVLQTLHTHHNSRVADLPNQPHVKVHLTNLALQTGITRFLEQPNDTTLKSYTPNSSNSPLWIYDKTSNETAFLTPTFWSQFDYAVVEDPARVIGAWSIVHEIPALTKQKPKLVRHRHRHRQSSQLLSSHDQNYPDGRLPSSLLVLGRSNDDPPLCTEWYGEPSRASASGSTVVARRADGQQCTFVLDGLYHLLRAMYGETAAWLYGLLHDVVREGYGIRNQAVGTTGWAAGGGGGLTGGYWIDWGLETRLYILQRDETGVIPNDDDDDDQVDSEAV